MKILLLGVGMQGKAALYDLVHHDVVTKIIAADLNIEALRAHIANKQYGNKVQCERVNAGNPENLNRLIGLGADVIINFTLDIPQFVRHILRLGNRFVFS